MSKLSISLDSLLRAPWAIHQPSINGIVANLTRRLEKDGEIVIERKEDVAYEVVNGKAIITVEGIFYNKLIISESWYAMDLDLEKTLIAAVDDPSVSEVILKITSPGGVVYGVSEMHDLILDLKKTKPIYGYVNGMACSALYWIPSACTKIFGYEQSDIGSIGVYMMHVDYSKYLEDAGIKVEFIKAGKYKTAGNAYEPMSEDTKEYLQAGVDQVYTDFTKSVASARNLDLEKTSEWAEGQVFEMKDGVKIGLADGIKSWQEMLGYEKNTFLLKGWRHIMGMGEPKIAELSVVDLQAKNPALYESIYETGLKAGAALGKESCDALQAELKSFKDAEQKTKDNSKIRGFAASLNLAGMGEQLITESKSVVEAFGALAVEASKAKADEQKKFSESAPKAAGQGSDTMADDLPKTDVEAMSYCKQKYNLTSKRDAWRKARSEFPKLFGNTVENVNEKEGE